jgi:3-hydroxyacyl-CoA dehydrogenase
MGRGIAGLAASAGIPVVLLDIPGEGDRDGPARKGLDAALKASPPAFLDPARASLVEIGNSEDDLGRLAECEWVVEAIPERPALKQELYAKLEPLLGPGTVVTTNTSGIPMAVLTRGRSESFRRTFFGTHFFNPPRVMHLLEVIAGPETDPEPIARISDFADRILGKGIVRAKDVPGFIANRLGVYGLVQAIRLTDEHGLAIGEVDDLTGSLLGRAPSAVFRTSDIVGLDVLFDTTRSIGGATGEDLSLPPWVARLAESGRLGAKTGAGFYKKEGKEILELDPKTDGYRQKSSLQLKNLETLSKLPLQERLKALLALRSRQGAFLRALFARTLHYAFAKAPELAYDLPAVDRAMEWGFGWELGPFALTDTIGVGKVRRLMAKEGLDEPPLLRQAKRAIYKEGRRGARKVLTLDGGYARDAVDAEKLSAGVLRRREKIVEENEAAALLDMDDGVALLQFRSKMGTLGDGVVRALLSATDRLSAGGWQGLVVGHDDPRAFSAGANLVEMLEAAREGRWDAMEARIRRFQEMIVGLRRAPFPVVAAPFGLTLAGGAELVLHADQVQTHAELQMGLVEAGVGLLPAGGGTKELLFRFTQDIGRFSETDAVKGVRHAFRLIATADVSGSALLARHLGWLRDRDGITMNRERLLADAKARVLLLARDYVAPPEQSVTALGSRGFGDLLVSIRAQREAGRASEHDALVGREIAYVLCGGDGAPRTVTESDVMDLEREGFLRLLGTERTQERIAYTLKTGKPLRN